MGIRKEDKVKKGIYTGIISKAIFIVVEICIIIFELLIIRDIDSGNFNKKTVVAEVESTTVNLDEGTAATQNVSTLKTEAVTQKTSVSKTEAVTQKTSVSKTEVVTTKSSEHSTGYDKYILVGDSRFVGMQKVCKDNKDIYIAENGVSYPFLEKNINTIKNSVTKDSVVVIGLGVNDVNYNVDKYINGINNLYETLGCKLCYMLINPVDEKKEEEYGYSVKNSKIAEFNNKIKKELNSNIQIIDVNSYITNKGFDTVDGLHYTSNTYKDIYEHLKNSIK